MEDAGADAGYVRDTVEVGHPMDVAQKAAHSVLQQAHVTPADCKPLEDTAVYPVQDPSVRKRTLTEKGLQYQIDCAKQEYKSESKKIRRQHALVIELLEAGNIDMLKQEVVNLDKRLSDAEVSQDKLMCLLPDNVQSADQQDRHDEIDKLVFEVKRRVCLFLKENEAPSAGSHSGSLRSRRSCSSSSHSSRRSNRSKVSNISKVESLRAVKDALEQTQMAKTEELECRLKLEKAKMVAQRTRLDQRIVKAQIEEGRDMSQHNAPRVKIAQQLLGTQNILNQMSENYPQHSTGADAGHHLVSVGSCKIPSQLSHTKPPQQTNCSGVEPSKPNISARTTETHSSKTISDLGTVMSKLVDLQIIHSAPVVDIDTFDGNPLEYTYFRATFTDAVEKLVKDPRGRLTRLLKYTAGDAKDLIKHCIHEDDNMCYIRAVELLDKEYGNQQLLSSSYLKELKKWPTIKFNDSTAYKKLHRFLLKGLSLKREERLRELDSDMIIRTCILSKMDPKVQEGWLKKVVSGRERDHHEPDFADVVKYVEHLALLASDPSYSQGAYQDDGNSKAKTYATQCHVKFARCLLCDGNHHLQDCEEFKDMHISERARIIYHNYLCFSCLEPISEDHVAKSCPKDVSCDICKENHPTVLHGYRPKSSKSFSVSSPEKSISMCIVPVRICLRGREEREIKTYALLDENSQSTFVHESLVDKLSAEKRRASVTTTTINGSKTEASFAVSGLIVKPSVEFAEMYPCTPMNLPAVYSRKDLDCEEDEIPTPGKIQEYEHLSSIRQKLPEYDETLRLGLIIGANCPRILEPQEVIPGVDSGPYASRSLLGWRVIGPMPVIASSRTKCFRIGVKIPVVDTISTDIADHHFTSSIPIRDQIISKELQHMYNVDFPEDKAEEISLSVEDARFLELMKTSVTKVGGHYQLPLPFRNPEFQVPNNRAQAFRRLESTRRRMIKDEAYRKDYCKFMNVLLEKGYAVQSDDTPFGRTWYIYHFGVREPKKNNKIRIVFDCSTSFRGFCLNDELLQGPDLTNHLLGVLLRFRKGKIGFVADIEAMFHQVRVPTEHQTFQKFLWWPEGDITRPPCTYQMCVHFFGAISSPSCANFALRQTVLDSEIDDSTAEEVISRNFYVDDMLRSEDTVEDAVKTIAEVVETCRNGGFNLTKFVCRDPRVTASIPEEKRSGKLVREFQAEHVERALGVHWCLDNDSLGFRIILKDSPLTRRGILSTISSIYDPIGLASPFLLHWRKILQRITALKDGWDSEVPKDLANRWRAWRQGLPRLEEVSVDRCYRPKDFGEVRQRSLHLFSDASEIGYGVASYIRQVDINGRIHVAMVFGKSRVTPTKSITIPRLELTAATVSVKIGAMLKDELSLSNLQHHYWTDSQITLGYIGNETRRFRIFVANRTAKIRDYTTKEQWHYVDTDENPADYASRGLTIDEDKGVSQWLNGPDFLWQRQVDRMSEELAFPVPEGDPEIRKTAAVLASKVKEIASTMLSVLEERVSSWTKIVRIIAYIRRFINNCRHSNKRVQVHLSTDDILEAQTSVLRLTQEEYFNKEIMICKSGDKSSNRGRWKSSAIWKLDPFLDENGLMRAGGRLKCSQMGSLAIHPIILPKKCQISRRLVEYYHAKVYHSGRTTTSNEIRQDGYWVINGNSMVRSVIHNCVTCRLLRGKLGEQKMANLPKERFSTEGPFTYTGLDMFGPFHIKEGRKVHKRFVALFTCLSSRAVHLESTISMDTDSFIQALRRFIARRGNVREILSDNGTNFVGAANEFKRAFRSMDMERVNDFLLTQSCDLVEWQRRPPTASHFGGVWERQIRTVRKTLSPMLRDHSDSLNDESFRTFLTEAECIVNSRPLTVDNLNDPTSLPLCPMNILTGKTRIVFPPPGNFQRADLYCRKRWRQVQHLANEFWSRWHKEFMSTLQTRQKWNDTKRNFQVNDVVLVKDEQLPRNQWPLARVIKVFESPGDNLVRRVELATQSSKSVMRPICKLVLLVEGEVEGGANNPANTTQA